MKAVDVSVYSGEISVDQWRQIKADGYALAIVGLFHGRTVNRYAAQQMRAAHEAGMLLAAYVLLAPWTGKSGGQQISLGIDQWLDYGEGAPEFLAVDCEIDGITSEMISSAILKVKDYGLRSIIYTGWWWWYGHFKDSRAFSHIPLWAADYDGEANLDTRMYGGWTKAVGKQYAGTTMLHGVNCDLNFFDDEFVNGPEGGDEMAFTEEDARLLREIRQVMRGDYVRVTGTDRVYEVESDQLTHILNPSVLAGLRDRFEDVRDLPPTDEIWRLPVYLPGGLPNELR